MHQKKYFIFLLIFFLQYCNPTDPPVDDTKLSLSLEDVSCTEAWIKLTGKPGSNIIITRDDKEIMRFNLFSEDTTIMNDSLLPNKLYVYQLLSSDNKVRSNKISVITMDTTSHHFTWQSWTFGEHSSSYLNDVSIIDENNIWAVGAIYMNDSLGNPDPLTYNAINWDGKKWQPKRISVNFRGNLITPILEGVFAFTDADIWFVGSLPIHGDGVNWKIFDLRTTVDPNLTLSKAWGASTDDIYCVGRKGNIAHYQKGKWQKIESGTEADIQDVWGSYVADPLILCAVSNVAELSEHKIIKILPGNKIDSIAWNTGRRVKSVWFLNRNNIFTSGGGVFIGNNYYWKEQTEVPLYFTERIRGEAINDVFVVGHFGLLAHFNGLNWRLFPEAVNARVYTSLDYKNNLMVTTGYTERKAVIQIMKKK